MSARRFWFGVAAWLVGALGASAVVGTVLPFLPTDAWWVRVLDFPRFQLAIVAAVTGALTVLVFDRRRRGVQVFVGLLVVAAMYQAAEVFPFTRLARPQVRAVGGCGPGRVSLLVANVLQANRNSAPFLAMARRLDPDLVLATETDQWWDRELSALAAGYPHAVRHPLENTYGIHLYSKLELIEPRVRFLVQEDIPSIHARLRLRSGALVEFHGVHPTPPQPARDTGPRDVELILVARQVAGDRRPTIVAGDLNDVGWSGTTRQFQDISGLLDPRVGRGLYATFNANWPLLQWPLDHVFVDASFSLLRMERLGHIGSDHFPIHVELCAGTPDTGARLGR